MKSRLIRNIRTPQSSPLGRRGQPSFGLGISSKFIDRIRHKSAVALVMLAMEDTQTAGQTADQAVAASAPNTKKGFLRFPRSWAEVKKLGWKFILAFVLFYLVRDTLLYLVLPYLILKGIISL